MKEEEINKFEKAQTQVKGLYTEISLLSKKNPNDAVNKFKLKFINQLLSESNGILGKKYKPFEDFNNFPDDELPTVSDVVMIFEQYLSCLEKFRSDNIIYGSPYWYWKTNDGKASNIKTESPHKFKR
jgi:hypothetical protein